MSDGWQFAASIFVAVAASASWLVALGRYRPGWMAAHGDAICLGAVFVGAIFGHAMLGLWPIWPPANALDRFLVVGLPATGVLLLLGGSRLDDRFVGNCVYAVLALSLSRILLHQTVYMNGNPGEAFALLAGSAGLLVVVNQLLMHQWLQTRQASIPFALAATLFAGGLLVAMAGYIKGGSTALLWSAAVAGTVVAACWIGARAELQGVTRLAVVLVFGTLFIGRYFGGITTGSALLLMFTPLACWVTELPGIRDGTTWQKQFLYLLMVGVTILVVLLIAKRTFDRDMVPLMGQVKTPTGVCRLEF